MTVRKRNAIFILMAMFSVISCMEKNSGFSDRENTINIFDNFSENDFKSTEAFEMHAKGIEKSRLGELSEAEEYFEEALQLDEGNQIILNSLAVSQTKLGKYQLAIKNLTEITTKDSTAYDSYINLIIAYSLHHEYAKAIQCADVIIKKQPNRRALLGAYFNKSHAQCELKMLDSALHSLDMAVKFCDDPEQVTILERHKDQVEKDIALENKLKDAIEAHTIESK